MEKCNKHSKSKTIWIFQRLILGYGETDIVEKHHVWILFLNLCSLAG